MIILLLQVSFNIRGLLRNYRYPEAVAFLYASLCAASARHCMLLSKSAQRLSLYLLQYLQNYREIHMHSTTFWAIWCSHTCCQTAKRRPRQIYNLVPVAPAEDTGYVSPVDVGVVFAVKITQSALSVGSEQERQIGRCTPAATVRMPRWINPLHSAATILQMADDARQGVRLSVCRQFRSHTEQRSLVVERSSAWQSGASATARCGHSTGAHDGRDAL